jgi:hypothetical protein
MVPDQLKFNNIRYVLNHTMQNLEQLNKKFKIFQNK